MAESGHGRVLGTEMPCTLRTSVRARPARPGCRIILPGVTWATVATALEAAAQDVLAACNAQCAWWLLLSPLAAAATNRPVLLLGRSVDSRGQRGSRTLRLVTEPGRRPARRAEYSRVHSRSWQQDSWPDSPETSSRKPRKSGRGALGERVDPSVADSEVTYQAALGWPQGTRESRPY